MANGVYEKDVVGGYIFGVEKDLVWKENTTDAHGGTKAASQVPWTDQLRAASILSGFEDGE